ncbi:WD40 repeat domain-containing protein [Candidatus Dependentiae bacterium]|nr:WD40 repeat domain-containing protein [Candidatus Dependentiae bacterium]
MKHLTYIVSFIATILLITLSSACMEKTVGAVYYAPTLNEIVNQVMITHLKKLPMDLKKHISYLFVEEALNYNFEFSKTLFTLVDVEVQKKIEDLIEIELLPVALSPDGKTILTGSLGALSGYLGRVRAPEPEAILWCSKTGKVLHILKGQHMKEVTCVAFSPDGKTVLTGSADGTVVYWDIENQYPLVLLPWSAPVTFLTSSPDGSTVFVGFADCTAVLWKIKENDHLLKVSDQVLHLIEHYGAICSVAFSPDGNTVLTGSACAIAQLWDTKTGQALLTLEGYNRQAEGHRDSIDCLAFSPDGSLVVTGSTVDDSALIWDIKTGKQVRTLEGYTKVPIDAVAFSLNGRNVLTRSISDKSIRFWDVSTGIQLGESAITLNSHVCRAGNIVATMNIKDYSISLSPEDALKYNFESFKTFFSIAYQVKVEPLAQALPTVGPLPLELEVSNTTHEDNLNKIIPRGCSTHNHKYFKQRDPVAFSPDSTTVFMRVQGTAFLWDIGRGEVVVKLQGHTQEITSGAFSPDGHKVLTGSADCTAILWDVKTGIVLHKILGCGPVLSVAFSPNGTTVLIGSDEAVLWSLTGENQPLVLEGHAGPIESVAFSPEGSIVLTLFRYENVVRFWDAKTGKQIKELPIEGRGFKYIGSAGGDLDTWSVLLANDKGGACVWNFKTGLTKNIIINTAYQPLIGNGTRSPVGLNGNMQPGFAETMSGAALNSMGEIIVTGSSKGQVCLWDASTGDLLKILKVPRSRNIRTVLFSPDSRALLVINDETAQLFTRYRDGDCWTTMARKKSAQKAYTEIYPLLVLPYKFTL